MATSSFWPSTPERTWRHYALAAPVVAVFIWYPFVQGRRVPILGWIDLAIHEFGHIATLFLPRVMNLAMGNGTQLLVPLGLAAGFWFVSKDPLGTALGLAWGGAAAQDASVYIADAPYQRLQLIGGVHDWGTLLGPAHLDALGAAEPLARVVWTIGLLLAVGSVVLLAASGYRTWSSDGRGAGAPPADQPRQPVPPRQPRPADDGWSVTLDP